MMFLATLLLVPALVAAPVGAAPPRGHRCRSTRSIGPSYEPGDPRPGGINTTLDYQGAVERERESCSARAARF